MKHTHKAYLFWEQFLFESAGKYIVLYFRADDSDYRVLVKEIEIEFEAPETHDPRMQQVAALKKQKTELQANVQVKLNAIDEKIQSLLALENKVEA